MRWGRTEAERQFDREVHAAYLGSWHRWFAWRPVQLGNGSWVWLETVKRKRTQQQAFGGWEDSGWYYVWHYEVLGQ